MSLAHHTHTHPHTPRPWAPWVPVRGRSGGPGTTRWERRENLSRLAALRPRSHRPALRCWTRVSWSFRGREPLAGRPFGAFFPEPCGSAPPYQGAGEGSPPPVALGPGACSRASNRPFGRPRLPDGSDGAVVRGVPAGVHVRLRVCRRGCFRVPGAHLRPEVPWPAVTAALGAAAYVSSGPRWAAGGPSFTPAAAPAATFPLGCGPPGGILGVPHGFDLRFSGGSYRVWLFAPS